jgi:fructoselysine-6-P-deglycase FrlB-like protein
VSHVEAEIASQPDTWRRAAELAASGPEGLPAAGERVAVVGCGTSLFMAQAYAVLREQSGAGETDAFAASEFPAKRSYDRIVSICRSGTTTEVLALLRAASRRTPTTAIIGDPNTPIVDAADHIISLDFADEQSVVQTRFATTVLTLLRASLGVDIEPLAAAAQQAVAEPLPADVTERTQFTFLGTGWSVGVASEAALKIREASQSWTEAYPAMEYRHGPASVTDNTSVVWVFGEPPAGLADEVAGRGGLLVDRDLDPVVDLIGAQRLAVALAAGRGLDPDHPRNLTRSVILG